MKKQNKEESSLYLNIALVGSILVTVVLAGFFSVTLFNELDGAGGNRVPRVIVLLITDLLEHKGDTEIKYDSMQFYLSYDNTLTPSEKRALLMEDFDNFSEILFSHNVDDKIESFTIEKITDNFVEITLFNSAKEPCYPKVGLAYILDDSGLFIERYTIGRLQPFSIYDEEYREAWGRV